MEDETLSVHISPNDVLGKYWLLLFFLFCSAGLEFSVPKGRMFPSSFEPVIELSLVPFGLHMQRRE